MSKNAVLLNAEISVQNALDRLVGHPKETWVVIRRRDKLRIAWHVFTAGELCAILKKALSVQETIERCLSLSTHPEYQADQRINDSGEVGFTIHHRGETIEISPQSVEAARPSRMLRNLSPFARESRTHVKSPYDTGMSLKIPEIPEIPHSIDWEAVEPESPSGPQPKWWNPFTWWRFFQEKHELRGISSYSGYSMAPVVQMQVAPAEQATTAQQVTAAVSLSAPRVVATNESFSVAVNVEQASGPAKSFVEFDVHLVAHGFEAPDGWSGTVTIAGGKAPFFSPLKIPLIAKAPERETSLSRLITIFSHKGQPQGVASRKIAVCRETKVNPEQILTAEQWAQDESSNITLTAREGAPEADLTVFITHPNAEDDNGNFAWNFFSRHLELPREAFPMYALD